MKACIGGTFDHLHKGHMDFLEEVFRQADSVYIGIVSDDFVKAFPLANRIQPIAVRKKALKDYLYSKGYLERVTIDEIKDAYGPATRASDLEAIFCTNRTKANALKINGERMKVALRPLRIIEIPLTEAEDGEPISSERIRSGEIDAEGKLPEPAEEEEEGE